MAKEVIIYGPDGQPIDRAALMRDDAEVTLTGVRRVQPEHPTWGLSPEGLGGLMRDSETSDPSRWYALLDDIHEKEWHYRGVLGQRRLALAQLQTTVDPASDDPEHVKHADYIRLMMAQPEMTLSKFDLSDALHKGIAFGQNDWDTSEGQWMPKAIRYTDTRWFRFSQVDLTTPMLLDQNGQPQPLTPYKWTVHRARLNSGLPIRDGLGRAASWAWMFKNFDIKSWLIFLEKYGQPLRLGRYPLSATPAERRQLLNALRNMGRDAAAIIPEGMTVEFPKTEGGGAGDAFQTLANYFDEQISKLVLGQTGTSDASKGGYAVGKVHDGVREAICAYDALVLSMTLNRDLVRPTVDLNFGPQKAYPNVRIGLGDTRNLELLFEHLGEFVDRGLKVEQSQIYPLFGLTEPAEGEDVELLKPLAREMPGAQPGSTPPSPQDDRAGRGGGGVPRARATLSAADDPVPAGDSFDEATAQILADLGWTPDIGALQAALAECKTIEEARAVMAAHVDRLGTDKVANILAQARLAARLAGETSAPDA